jgi:mannose-6-phosphate isomerase-like protein (cupin superfamily)
MLVRRLSDAPEENWHKLRTRILMDAGELGSRHLSVCWLEVPAEAEQELHSHEEAEQAYVVARGTGEMTVAGDTQEIAEGDLVLIPPATDHSIANRSGADLCLISVQSPAVTLSEVFGSQLAADVVGGFEDDE